jgi:hypothetical protein
VTGGWNDAPRTSTSTTRFDGTPVRTMPQIRDYFSQDVIPVFEHQRTNYDSVTSTSKINFIGPLVLIIGIIVVIWGLLMVLLAWQRPPPTQRTTTPIGTPANAH